MKIEVNGTSHRVETTNLVDILKHLGWGDAHVATALNGRIVPFVERADTTLAEGDRLEVLSAMQGG